MRSARRSLPRVAFVLGAAGALAACGSPTAPAFPLDTPPTAMALTYGGFGFGSHDVASRGDTLVVTRRQFSTTEGATVTRVVPTPAEWHAFWRAADAAGVRRWPANCRNDRVADGGGYTLELSYPGGRITSSGTNSYPQRDGRCSGDPEQSPEFRAFAAAVSRLIGRSYP